MVNVGLLVLKYGLKITHKISYMFWEDEPVLIIDMFNKDMSYYKEYDSFCYQNCLRQILEYYGLQNAPLFINASLSFIVQIFGELPGNYKIIEDKDARSVLPNYSHKVKRTYPDTRSISEIWDENKSKVREGYPLITAVDIFYLEYLTFFKKNHGRHTVVLSGYLEKEKHVCIIDWYEPWFFKGSISVDNFLAARESENPWDGGIYSGVDFGKNWAWAEKDGWTGTVDELLSQTIQLSINQYYNSTNVGNNYPGLLGLKLIYNMLLNLNDISESDKKAFLKDLHRNLYKLHKRQLFFKFYLEYTSSNISITYLNDAIYILSEIANKLEGLLLLIIKGSVVCKDVLYQRILAGYKEHLELEEKLCNVLNRLQSILLKN